MIILASDTSTKSLSVAIRDSGKTVFSETVREGSVHSENHMPLIEKALRECSLGYNDIGLLACSVGPGSYTGIRINVSSMKAISYASGIGVIGVSTLKALEYPFRSEHAIICPLLDARNRRVFAAASLDQISLADEDNYSFEDILEHLVTACYILSADKDSNSKINRMPSEIVFCGDAAMKLKEDHAAVLFERRVLSLISGMKFRYINTEPEAADIAAIANDMCIEGAVTDPFILKAEYISPSQAERAAAFRDEQITVREALLSDFDSIEQIENSSFAIPWSGDSLRNDLLHNTGSKYLIAEYNGITAGFISFSHIFGDAQITNLAVSETFRRKGTGRLLLISAFAAAEDLGCTNMMLEVRAGNKAAIRLYISEGFRSIGIRKGYYENNGENAIIMLKDLLNQLDKKNLK